MGLRGSLMQGTPTGTPFSLQRLWALRQICATSRGLGWVCAGRQARAEWLCSQVRYWAGAPGQSGKMRGLRSSDHKGQELVEKGELFRRSVKSCCSGHQGPHQGTPQGSVSYPVSVDLAGIQGDNTSPCGQTRSQSGRLTVARIVLEV